MIGGTRMTYTKYRNRYGLSDELEAVQWDGTNRDEIETFVGDQPLDDGTSRFASDNYLFDEDDGWRRVGLHDWIVKADGVYFPYRPDWFIETFEAIDPTRDAEERCLLPLSTLPTGDVAPGYIRPVQIYDRVM